MAQASRSLRALAAFDHCVKTRVDGLQPSTQYFYRFSYVSRWRSRHDANRAHEDRTRAKTRT